MGASGMQYRLHKWSELQEENIVIMKRGHLLKQSKYLKDWRKRTVIVANGYIISFKDNDIPTCIIKIIQISNLLKQQEESFFILSIHSKAEHPIYFKTKDEYERDQWFSLIKAEKIRGIKESNFTIEQDEDQVHNYNHSQIEERKRSL